MPQDQLSLTLTPEEINLLLEALGNMPFVKVYTLIGKIQAQAAAQLQAEGRAAASPGPAEA
jgi:hypothetical protein